LPEALMIRANCLVFTGRRLEAAMCLREAARLADEHQNASAAAMAYLNLSNVLSVDDAAAAADAARRSVELGILAGERFVLGFGVGNLVIALAATAGWAEAAETLTDHPSRDLFADDELVAVTHAWFSALRGDADVADELLGRLDNVLASEDAQDIAAVATARALVGAARGDHETALRLSRISVAELGRALSFGGDDGRWAWPLAARSAHELGDLTAEAELLDLVERQPRGDVAPMQRAEALLIRARLSAAGHAGHDSDPAEQFIAAIEALRSSSTPYHLAHGLLDHAAFLAAGADRAAAERAVAEARSIASALGCRPLLVRADALTAPLGRDAAVQR
jgi:hypothetical protein